MEEEVTEDVNTRSSKDKVEEEIVDKNVKKDLTKTPTTAVAAGGTKLPESTTTEEPPKMEDEVDARSIQPPSRFSKAKQMMRNAITGLMNVLKPLCSYQEKLAQAMFFLDSM